MKPKSSNITKSKWLKNLSYTQKQRLCFLEARLLWDGMVNRKDVCDQFGVSANHLTREISNYRNYFPNNLMYDVSTRAYRPTKEFDPGFTSGNPEEYLNLLILYAFKPTPELTSGNDNYVAMGALPRPQCTINRNVLRGILIAIRESIGCDIQYQSFTQEEESKRTIWPHALAWTGDRWHVRAYDSVRKKFIDIVLQRIIKLKVTDISHPFGMGEDKEWKEIEEIDIVPNSKLSLSQQAVVAREYGMEKTEDGYVWTVKLKRCMIPYFLHRYHLDQKKPEKHSQTINDHITVKDETIIDNYSFKSEP